jgi:hypothetical protein
MKRVKKRIYTKSKFIKHLTLSGNSERSESILLKNIKEIQKESKKISKNIVALSLRNNISFFKLHTFKQKKRKTKSIKEVPGFIVSKSSRTSYAIKDLVKFLGNEKIKDFGLKNKIVSVAKASNKDVAMPKQMELQKKISAFKHLFKYFKLH